MSTHSSRSGFLSSMTLYGYSPSILQDLVFPARTPHQTNLAVPPDFCQELADFHCVGSQVPYSNREASPAQFWPPHDTLCTSFRRCQASRNSTETMVPARNSCNQTSVKLLEGRIAYDLALGPDLNHGFNSCEFLPRCPPVKFSAFARASEPTLVSCLVPCRNRACISTSTKSR